MTRHPYIVFRDGDEQVVGLRGPYMSTEAAQTAAKALLDADEACLEGMDIHLVDDPAAMCMASWWYGLQVMDLSVEEIKAMEPR